MELLLPGLRQWRTATNSPLLTHRHIIKRFDTDAVSASSLFRAAYPLASDSEEATEMAWISKSSRSRYGDTKKAGAEHDDSRKLSGTWCAAALFAWRTEELIRAWVCRIPATSAASLAKEYKILRFATELIDYTPTPAVESIEIVDSENDASVPPCALSCAVLTRL